MKLWIDDVRPAPEGYKWRRTVWEAEDQIHFYAGVLGNPSLIEIIDIDHDAGKYAKYGGDYIEFLKYLERKYPNVCWNIHIHSMNPVGIANMRAIIQKNGWKEVF